MALSLRNVVCVASAGSVEFELERKEKAFLSLNANLAWKNNTLQCSQHTTVLTRDEAASDGLNPRGQSYSSIHSKASTLWWWEKGNNINMKEIRSEQELFDSLLNAGNKLVVVSFYSPSCGGCRALHPKMCQLTELNPNASFLKVNYEELKDLCKSLHVYVLPFFQLYHGSQGRVCSFSCTNATINKLKSALAKHGTSKGSETPLSLASETGCFS